MAIETFHMTNPLGEQQEHMTNLVKELQETTMDYLDKTIGKKLDIADLFMVRDSTIGFAAMTMNGLIQTMKNSGNPSDMIGMFIDQAERIFEIYASEMREKND